MIDPVLLNIAYATIAAIVLIAAIAKMRRPFAFRKSVAAYQLLPQGLVAPIAFAVPLCEVSAALGMLFPATRMFAAYALIALFVVFALALAANIVRGNTDIDCGCLGFVPSMREVPQGIGWAHVLRVVLLALVTTLAFMPSSPRPIVWFDYLTVLFGTLLGLAASLIFDELLANRPKLNHLRNS